MKKSAIILSVAALAFSFTSCNDWLDDVPNKSNADDAMVFSSAESVDLYVNGFYTWLNTYGQFGERQFSGSWTEAMTDVMKYSGSTGNPRAGQPNVYSQSAVPMSPGGNLASCWDNAYSAIRRVNQFLELEKQYGSGYDSTLRLRWQAQARFFRAFMHFQLAKRHGGSIIIYDTLPVKDKARATAEEVWQFIEDDLDFAAGNLPDNWNSANTGRITSFAALAFKSRVMLYAERWQSAFNAAFEVIEHGPYDLVDDYAEACKGNNKESIIQFSYNRSLGPNTSFDANYAPATDGSTASCGAAPTQELVESYEKKDGSKIDWTPWHGTTTVAPPYSQLEPRFAATVLYPGCKWKGLTLDMSVDGQNVHYFDYGVEAVAYGNTCSGYLVRKLLNEKMTDVVTVKSDQPWVELRFAEVLLNYAEAAYRLDKIEEAQKALKRVRKRVGLPAKTSTGDAFFADYRNERKIELAFEGQLYWDMTRWQLAHIDYNNYRRHGIKVDNGSYTYVEIDRNDQMFSEKCYVFPVPVTEMQNNNLIEQYVNWQ